MGGAVMETWEKEELEQLRRYVEDCSLGDRPISPAAQKLKRLWELEERERKEAGRGENAG